MPDDRPATLVVRTAGINCEAELCRAFEMAGGDVDLVHLDRLIEDPGPIDRAGIIAFPGGFSYGDDVASGRIFAARVRDTLAEPLRRAVDRGALVLGVCNGFQVLVQAGLLPGGASREAAGPSISVTHNASARFEDRWVEVTADPSSPCVWTAPLADPAFPEHSLRLPVAHGEGRVVFADEGVLADLERNGQIPLRYDDNFNGSHGAAAGVCDPTGRVFGLMPHPERYLDWRHHPFWTRLPRELRRGRTPGLAMFVAAVEHAMDHAAVV